jgi:hypothetical protein
MPAELTVGFGLGRCPAASNWCGYTPRPELLLRPEDLGPPLLPPMWWEGARGVVGGRTRHSDRGIQVEIASIGTKRLWLTLTRLRTARYPNVQLTVEQRRVPPPRPSLHDNAPCAYDH